MTKILSHFRASFGLAGITIFILTLSAGGLLWLGAGRAVRSAPAVVLADTVVPSGADHAAPDVAAEESDVSGQPEPDPAQPLDPPLEDPPATTFEPQSKLIIAALNPGYTVDNVRDSGEFVELKRMTDEPLDLTDYAVRYINASDKATDLISFAEGSLLNGETLLLGLARTMSGQADANYMTTIAMSAGTLQIVYRGEVVDTVCWGKIPCLAGFKSAEPTSLVRNLETGEFSHDAVYHPRFDSAQSSLFIPQPPEQPDSETTSESGDAATSTANAICRGIEFTEIFSYYADSKAEQFIELHNFTDQTTSLAGCAIKYKNKTYPLGGELGADGYQAIFPDRLQPNFSLTKNPNSSNTVELVDQSGQTVDLLVYNHGQKKSTSFALFYDQSGAEIWQQTYAVTPGSVNNYQEFRTCPAGKVINPATGNCVKATKASQTVSDCPAGKYRNPLTGRCKNIASASKESKPCAEGYERNPETNRCRKISASNEGAGYALVPTTGSGRSTFVAFGVVALVVGCGVIYIVVQFRREIARAFRKVRQRFHHIRKDHVAWRARFHRHK